MVARILRAFVVLHSISVLIPTSCYRKKDIKIGVPDYHLHPSDNLPSDVQITTHLLKGESKRFFYASQTDRGALSVTLISCTSPVRWSFEMTNATNDTHLTETMDTYHLRSISKGSYTLHLVALEQSTYVHVYVSTEEGGPQALQQAKFTKLRLLKRQSRKRLTVKWNPSFVDPQGTDYCLVISTRKSHGSLCAAQTDHQSKDPLIACVGHKTHYTLNDLKQGQQYYFNLFATNHQSNFTYPYGETEALFDGHSKPMSLRDGKTMFANLKKFDGKAVFRYKVGKKVTKSLDLFIMPCGGAIDVEVTLKDSTVVPPRRIDGFGKVSIPDPARSARYYIKIFALNREELRKTTGVEIYATTKPAKAPLPNMPQIMKVQEYQSLKTCNSVTVGWMAAPVQKTVHYCLVTREGQIRETDGHGMPNQCGLESRLKKSSDFISKYCIDAKYDKEKVIVQKVNHLEPGRNYVVQVTVKKPKGKTLSYDLLQVFTKPLCKKQQ